MDDGTDDVTGGTAGLPAGSGRRLPEVRVVPLVFGLAFCVIGVSALVADVDDLDLDVAWLWAIALGVLGVGGLTATIDGLRRSRRASG